MGVTGLRAAALSGDDSLSTRTDREAAGWGAWMPVAFTSIAAHAVGGVGLIVANRGRHRRQREVMPLTVAKAAVTGAALASTAAQGMLGRRLAERQHAADSGNVDAKEQVDRLRLQVRVLGMLTPALTGTLVILASREGELQRAGETLAGTAASLAGRARDLKDTVLDRTGLAA